MPSEFPHDALSSFPAQVRTRDGLSLFATHWPAPGTPRGVACLVHGLGEHSGRYTHVVKAFHQQGWTVVTYDHRGHGQSPGPRGGLKQSDDLLHDLAAVIDTVRASHPGQRLLVLGHSLGGLVVSRFVSALASPSEGANWQRPVDLCVLSSPALDLGMSGFQKALLNSVGSLMPDMAVSNGLKPEWVCSDASVVRDYVDDPLVHDRITGRLTRFMVEACEVVHDRAASWTVPTLLLYAGADHCVPPAGSERFAKAAPSQMLTAMPYPEMAHEIFHEPEKARVLADLMAWVNLH
jgi:alpha-beta hydrolase superfamily lysophospholipase